MSKYPYALVLVAIAFALMVTVGLPIVDPSLFGGITGVVQIGAVMVAAILSTIVAAVNAHNVSRAQTYRAEIERIRASNAAALSPGHGAPSKVDFAPRTRREALEEELLSDAKVDDLKATFALSLIPIIVISGILLTGYLDGGVAPDNNAAMAYALVKRLGFLGVTFYLAHAAVSQYRYSTLRAAHYRACAQAISACDDYPSSVKIYKMLLPPHAFGAAPTSPVDALVKIAAGKDKD